MAEKSAQTITFFLKPGAARNVDALQAARAQGTFAVLMVSGVDEIRGEIARMGMLVDGGFENAAYDLKYHLRGLAVQIFYRFDLLLRVACG